MANVNTYKNSEDRRRRLAANARRWRSKNPDRVRASNLRHLYGISTEDYDKLLTEQNGACALCCKTVDYNLHVDHCHETGKVRGLLCRACNVAMGTLGDNLASIRKVVGYLSRST